MIIIDAYGRFRGDDERKCEFCGCWTNAKLRFCCDEGLAADRARSAERRSAKAVPK